tara:strand:- start:1807 stop:2409 length:603 start_codon:yes stop_codon:yes gene_type:complete
MIETMMAMQDNHNKVLHEDWRHQGHEYYRAVWVECAELMDHFGWKWWKKQNVDIDQVKLEIVDIWHFGLSDLMRSGSVEGCVTALNELQVPEKSAEPSEFREAVETLAKASLAYKTFQIPEFCQLLVALPLSVTELFRLYVGKNVLNDFRQAHGYRTGNYKKMWDGMEDNQHLIELLDELRCPVDEVPAALYEALQRRYP